MTDPLERLGELSAEERQYFLVGYVMALAQMEKRANELLKRRKYGFDIDVRLLQDSIDEWALRVQEVGGITE